MTKFRGTNGSDTLIGTAYDDKFFGRRGDDIIHTGDGNDIVYAGGGRDTIFAGDGNNDIYGGGGRDTFAFEDGASGVTTLMDWQDGRDTIDLTGLGITSIDELQISTSGGWTTIDAGSMTIRMDASLNSSPLSAGDFVFADAGSPTPPPPPPLPANATLYDFDNMLTWSSPEFSTKTGSFVADFNGLSGWNESVASPLGNGYIFPTWDGSFGDPLTRVTVSADTTVMASDTFDFESFTTRGPDPFTVIGFNDGVEVGRQVVDGVTTGEWTTVNLDDAIFDVVDEVEFIGLHDLDDMLIFA